MAVAGWSAGQREEMIVWKPLVSVVMPIRNERDRIGRTLDSVLAQEYPPADVEILVVDGMSVDGTREIVHEYMKRCERIRLLDNPKKTTPCAMNVGIRAAVGSYIIRVDGHTVLPTNYVSLCVNHLQLTGAGNVGGTMAAMGDSFLGKAIAVATSSPFGVGNSKFHYSRTAQWVDTVYLGAFRRSVFDEVGLYNEELVCNQDYELNYRIRQAGGRIYYTPDIVAYYYGRDRLGRLWRQYYQYGLWKSRVIALHPRSMQPRHLAAPLFLAGFVVLGPLSLLSPVAGLLLGLELSAYAFASFVFSIRAVAREGWRCLAVLPLVFLTLHLAWGLGFWRGAAEWFARLVTSGVLRQPSQPHRNSTGTRGQCDRHQG